MVALIAVATLLAGCEGSTTVVITDEPCCIRNSYQLAVTVSDTLGYTLGGAEVELVVATVPEQRRFARTDRNEVAIFHFDAPPDVVAIAYACAPGYQCNASDVGTRPDRSHLDIFVVLRF